MAWLGLAVSSRTDLCSVWIINHVIQVQYADPQQDHTLLTLLSSQPFDFRYRYIWFYQCKL